MMMCFQDSKFITTGPFKASEWSQKYISQDKTSDIRILCAVIIFPDTFNNNEKHH